MKQLATLSSERQSRYYRLDRRVLRTMVLLILLTIGATVISVGYGEYPISPLAVISTILGLPTDNPDHAFIIWTLRLPRSLVAWGVGVGLGLAGTLIQSLTRNSLASPDIIGINAGAALAAVTAIVLFPSLPAIFLPPAAFGGAMLVAILIYGLAWKGGISPLRLILVGVGLSLIAGAIVDAVLTFGNIREVSQALVWLAGSTYGRSWEHLYALIPWLVLFGGASLFSSRDLNVIHLGDEIARGLGIQLERQRGLLLLSGIALAGASVATAGSIGFVGLMAPHLGRKLVGVSHEGLLPIAALIGGFLVVVSDLLGRSLFAPIELPCGIITAIIGAPYFLYLLIRARWP
ncbi:MAG TPA: iron ABC transporter permease [Stenomitos sp.]